MRDLTMAISQAEPRKRANNPTNTLRWNTAIIVSILFLGLLYLFQVNALGTKGYMIGELETGLDELRAENKHLEVKTAELKSISRIQAEAQARSFVPIAGVNYITDGGVALK